MVVADTSSVNYAILIDEIELLNQLYGVIVIPVAVVDEFRDPRARESKKLDGKRSEPCWKKEKD